MWLHRFYQLENVLVVVEGGTTAAEVVKSLAGAERRALERGRAKVEGWTPNQLFDVAATPRMEKDVNEVRKEH